MEWRLWRRRGLEGSQPLMVEMAILALHGTGWQALSEMVGVKNSLWEVVKMGAFLIECPPERGDLHPRSIRFGLGHTQQSVWRKESWAGKVSPLWEHRDLAVSFFLWLLSVLNVLGCIHALTHVITPAHTEACMHTWVDIHMHIHTIFMGRCNRLKFLL